MSRDLVTLAQARRHLRRDEDDIGADPDLSGMISGASETIITYLKSAADKFLDTAGEVIQDSAGNPLGVPKQVQSATLILIGYLDRNRDSDEGKGFDAAHLPQPVRALLGTIRVPTLA